jgi:hypothetical protein
MTFGLAKLLGSLAGIVLCCLPSLLLLRHERRLTAEEWCAQFPRWNWVTKAYRGIWLLVFLSFMPVVMTTDMSKQINWFLLPCVFPLWLFALGSILEVGTQTSVAMWVGRGQAPLVHGPNARLAGMLRFGLTALVLALFFSYR